MLIMNYVVDMMNLLWLLILLLGQVLCEEVCTTQSGGITFTLTCTGNEFCCTDKLDCCSKLSTTAIIAFAVGGAVVLAIIVVVIIYAIVQHKKKSSTARVQPIYPTGNTEPPAYTPRVLANHPPPEPPPRYEEHASGSTLPHTQNAPTQQSERKIPL